ncbi:hypothetical protein BC832DRAFT_522185, partial [Gaertneriomyces semiglobifer]
SPKSKKPFLCPVASCQRTFRRMEHLNRHTRMHTGEKPYECDFVGCCRRFSRSDNLAAHKRTHAK